MNYPQKRNITFCFLKNPSAFKKVDNYPFFILPYERPVLGTPLVQIKKKIITQPYYSAAKFPENHLRKIKLSLLSN